MGARRNSEPFRYGDALQSESDVFRQAHPSLLEYMRGINGYVPPPAMIQGLMAARADAAGGEPSPPPIRHVAKSDVQSQPGFSWVDQQQQQAVSVSPTPGGTVFPQFGQQQQPQHVPLDLRHDGGGTMEQGGIYVPGGVANPGAVMAQAVGTFGYPAELNGDGTWQQLMVQLGVMDGHNS